MTDHITITQIHEDDIQTLRADMKFGSVAKYDEFVRLMHPGQATVLGAWDKEKPVGDLLIDWAGATDPSVVTVVNCPNIKHVFVHPSYRGRGIGSKLIQEGEAIAKAKGIYVVGLGFGVDNISARKLYLRLRYVESGVPILRNRRKYVDYELGPVDYKEDAVYLIKRLYASPTQRTILSYKGH